MSRIHSDAFEHMKAYVAEAVAEALHTLRNNKLRSGLVILGVLIGIASLMGMVATISGLSAFISSSISGGDTPLIWVQKANVLSGEGRKEWLSRKDLEIDDAFAIARLPHVRSVMIAYGRGMVVKYKNRKSQLIQVVGTNQPLLAVQNINMGEGRFFTESEEERRRKVAVLGDKTAKSLFPDEDPIGKMVRIEGKEYQVLGIFAKRKTIFGGLADNLMAIPYTAFERDFMLKEHGLEFHAIIDDMANIDAAEGDIRSLMRMRRKVPPGQPDDFAITTVNAAIEFTESITKQVGLVLIVLSSIALMVGGIGVMVIMLVSVTERTREIGIRKAIGATRAQITWQFLIEAATLSGIGGVLGLVAGIAMAFFVAKLLGFPFSLPIGWAIVSIVMSASVGLFFGIFPARKAAKLDPIVALRYE